MDIGARVDAVLVTGGRWHDFDFARLQVLAQLDRHDVVRTQARSDYADLAALLDAAVLISYTCDVRPTSMQTEALREWLNRGGRWLAFHGTNSAIDSPPAGSSVFSTPRVIDGLADVLGGQFLGHPSIGPYLVEVTAAEHPLVDGLGPFETTDELYVCEMRPPVNVLMHTRFAGVSPGFAEGRAPDDEQQPVLWQKRTGRGVVTYLTLGHCRGRWDVADRGVADTGRLDRLAWVSTGFRSVFDRAIAWAVHGDDWPSCPALRTDT